jgi:hypothetical protein
MADFLGLTSYLYTEREGRYEIYAKCPLQASARKTTLPLTGKCKEDNTLNAADVRFTQQQGRQLCLKTVTAEDVCYSVFT